MMSAISKDRCLFLFLSFITIIVCSVSVCRASTTGQGDLSVGISVDNHKAYKGLDLDYNIQGDAYMQKWMAAINVDYSDAKNRPSAISGHQYLYDSSAISTEFSHQLESPSPYITWQTIGNYTQSGESGLLGKRLYNWRALTGPSFNKIIRQDIVVVLDLTQGLEYLDGQDARTTMWSAELQKKFGNSRALSTRYQKECWKYKYLVLEDSCRNVYEIKYASMGASTEFNINVGQASIRNESTLLYGVGMIYSPNSINRLEIYSEKRNRRFIDVVASLEGGVMNASSESVVVEHSLNYRRQFKRFSMSAGIKKTTYAEEIRTDKDRFIDASYLLGSKACPSCSIEAEYVNSQKELDNWNTWMFGVKYPLKQHWDGLLSLRRSSQVNGENIISINMQLNYTGKAALVSN